MYAGAVCSYKYKVMKGLAPLDDAVAEPLIVLMRITP